MIFVYFGPNKEIIYDHKQSYKTLQRSYFGLFNEAVSRTCIFLTVHGEIEVHTERYKEKRESYDGLHKRLS